MFDAPVACEHRQVYFYAFFGVISLQRNLKFYTTFQIYMIMFNLMQSGIDDT